MAVDVVSQAEDTVLWAEGNLRYACALFSENQRAKGYCLLGNNPGNCRACHSMLAVSDS